MNKYFSIFNMLFLTLSACTTVNLTPSSNFSLTSDVTEMPTRIIKETTVAPLPIWSVASWYEQVEINCSIYVETSWGNGPSQWGDPILSPAGTHDSIPHLAFGPNGDFYLTDIPNHRLLKYNGLSQTPEQVIPIPDNYYLDVSTPYITQDHIYIPHTFNKLGILSFDGKEEKSLELPENFSYLAPTWTYILMDSQGGLFLNGINEQQLAYFNAGWSKENWNKVSSSAVAIFTPLIWNNFLVSQGSSLSDERLLIYLREIDPKIDFLKITPEPIDTGAKSKGLALTLDGVDREGWAYFGTARFSIFDHRGQIGKYPENITGNIIQSNIAPDGTIYLIVYDREDVTVQPKIMRCRFP
jgi:hypothetical protein